MIRVQQSYWGRICKATVAMSIVCLAGAFAQDPSWTPPPAGESINGPAPALPPNVDPAWWQQVQQNIAAQEYEATPADADSPAVSKAVAGAKSAAKAAPQASSDYLQAPNRAQRFRTIFNGAGISLQAREPEKESEAWELGLELSSVGAAEEDKAGKHGLTHKRYHAPRKMTHDARRIDYQRDGMTEWFENSEQGLKQNFTIDTPPDGNPAQIAVEIAVAGTFTPVADAAGQTVEFTNAYGVSTIQYTHLAVTDKTGKTLPAHFETGDAAIRIVIDARGAEYPLTVDPLVSRSSWTMTDPRSNIGFGLGLALGGDLNGDGYGDAVFADPYFNNSTGVLYVFYGGPGGLGSMPDATIQNPNAGSPDAGGSTKPLFGQMLVISGDINGDGYDDIVAGEPGHDFDATKVDTGSIHLFLGDKDGVHTARAWSLAAQNDSTGDSIPGQLAVGDVNGDKLDDIIATSPHSTDSNMNNGALYVWYTKSNTKLPEDQASWKTVGGQVDAALFGLAVGDINGDGISDVVVGGPPGQSSTPGRVYAYFGSYPGGLDGAAGGLGVPYPDGNYDTLDPTREPSWRALVPTNGDPNPNNRPPNTRFGREIRIGDLNGDGIGDVVVAAYTYYFQYNNANTEGAVFIYNGSRTLGSTPRTDVVPSNTLRGTVNGGGTVNEEFGYQLACGDVNADGFDDLAVSHENWPASGTRNGKVEVYLGSANGVSDNSIWKREGDTAGKRIGYPLSLGDVDGDGRADLAMGNPGTWNRAEVWYGSGIKGSSSLGDWEFVSSGQFTISTDNMALGNLNGDAYPDLIFGDGGYDKSGEAADRGRVYIVYGSQNGFSKDVLDWTIIDGETQLSYFGGRLDVVGDLNHDGTDEFVVGAPGFGRAGTSNTYGEGRVYLFYGSIGGQPVSPYWRAVFTSEFTTPGDDIQLGTTTQGLGDVNGDGTPDIGLGANYRALGAFYFLSGAAIQQAVASAPANTVVQEAVGSLPFKAYGVYTGQYLGTQIHRLGDINGDHVDDFAITAEKPFSESRGSRLYVYFGGSSFPPAGQHDDANNFGITAAGVGFYLEGDPNTNDGLGSKAIGADVNGDGDRDLIVSAYRANSNSGKIMMWPGGKDLISSVSGSASWTFPGIQPGAYLGGSLTSLGDINADGVEDILFGTGGYDSGGLEDVGVAYIVMGRKYKVAEQQDAKLPSSPDLILQGSVNKMHFAQLVAASDLNKDGYPDIVIGAYAGVPSWSSLHVFYGPLASLSSNATPVLAPISGVDAAGAQFGASLAAADLNGDTYDDLIVGAPNYDGGATDSGGVFIFSGGISGLSTTPVWTWQQNSGRTPEGAQRIGYRLAAGGDLNADTYSDFIVSGEAGGKGIVYPVLGSPVFTLQFTSGTAPFVAKGSTSTRFGAAISFTGDINSDGRDEIAVGAPGENRVYLYKVDTVTNAFVSGDDLSGNTPLSGSAASDFGYAVSGGDFDGDGYGDLAVGAPMYSNEQGQLNRFYSNGSTLGTVPERNIGESRSRLGTSVVVAGDLGYNDTTNFSNSLTQDGIADVIVGAPSDGTPTGGNGNGFIKIYYGRASHTIPSEGWVWNQACGVSGSSTYTDAFAGALVGGGDFNADGYPDLAVGAAGFKLSNDTAIGRGRVYAMYGPFLTTSNNWCSENTYDWFQEGAFVDANFAEALAIGDFNGDRVDDLAAGSPGDGVGNDKTGTVDVYFGGPPKPSAIVQRYSAKDNPGPTDFGNVVRMSVDFAAGDDGSFHASNEAIRINRKFPTAVPLNLGRRYFPIYWAVESSNRVGYAGQVTLEYTEHELQAVKTYTFPQATSRNGATVDENLIKVYRYTGNAPSVWTPVTVTRDVARNRVTFNIDSTGVSGAKFEKGDGFVLVEDVTSAPTAPTVYFRNADDSGDASQFVIIPTPSASTPLKVRWAWPSLAPLPAGMVLSKIEARLEKQLSNGTWQVVSDWTDTDPSSETASETGSYTFTGVTPELSFTYRASLRAYQKLAPTEAGAAGTDMVKVVAKGALAFGEKIDLSPTGVDLQIALGFTGDQASRVDLYQTYLQTKSGKTGDWADLIYIDPSKIQAGNGFSSDDATRGALYVGRVGDVSITWVLDTGPLTPQTYLVDNQPVPGTSLMGVYHTDRPGKDGGTFPTPAVKLGGVDTVTIYYNGSGADEIPSIVNPTASAADRYPALWVSGTTGELHAREITGYVLIGFEELPDKFLGMQPVEVRDYAPDSTDTFRIGDRLEPTGNIGKSKSDPGYVDIDGVAPIITRGGTGAGATDFLYQHQVDGSPMYGYVYAIRKTTSANNRDAEVFWMRKSDSIYKGVTDLGLTWPFEMARYQFTWPAENFTATDTETRGYQVFVRDNQAAPDTRTDRPSQEQPYGAAVAISRDLNPSLMPYREGIPGTAPAPSVEQDPSSGFLSLKGDGWALLRYRPGNEVYFLPVRSVNHDNQSYESNRFNAVAPWAVGKEITDDAHSDYNEPVAKAARPGYVHRTPGAFPQYTRYDWSVYDGFDGAAKQQLDHITGQIVPINSGNLEVWWYQKEKVWNPVSRKYVSLDAPTAWPSTVRRYACKWPDDSTPPELPTDQKITFGVSNTITPGSGVGIPVTQVGTELYYQNTNNLLGFNPNSEHALILPSNVGVNPEIFALRDDLKGVQPDFDATGQFNPDHGKATADYVIAKFRETNGEWTHKVYKVSGREMDNTMIAGRYVYPPYPLSLESTFPYVGEEFYIEGSVDLSTNSSAVTGRGTAWTVDMAGMDFIVDGVTYKISSVTSATLLTLKTSYTGTTVAKQSYAIKTKPGSQGVAGPYWEDRTFRHWARAATTPNDSAQPALKMEFFYPIPPDKGFYFDADYKIPALTTASAPRSPQAGDRIPWLSNLTDDARYESGIADYSYEVGWPRVPEMYRGDVLVKAKSAKPGTEGPVLPAGLSDSSTSAIGLPAVEGQVSVDIIYEQANEVGKDSVKLVDYKRFRPFRPGDGATPAEKSAWLSVVLPEKDLPQTIKTENYGGLVYFTDLTPGLKERVYYDKFDWSASIANDGPKLKFRGIYVEPDAGDYYILPNIISEAEYTTLRNLASGSAAWTQAVDALRNQAQAFYEVPNGTTEFEGLALTTGKTDQLTGADLASLGITQGTNGSYVTLAMQNATAAAPLPVTLEIIKVVDKYYRGEIAEIQPLGVFDDKLVMKHKKDSIGEWSDDGSYAQQFVYEWRFAYQDTDGMAPDPFKTDVPVTGDLPTCPWQPIDGLDKDDHTDNDEVLIQNSGIDTLVDHYFVCRYRKKDETDWSAWTQAKLGEGWIARVFGRIDPFTQRGSGGGIEGAEVKFSSFGDDKVNTIVSMISQAGPRYEGNVPLNERNLDNLGLIQIYETALAYGRRLSIDDPGAPLAGSCLTDEQKGSQKDALFQKLQLAAGRISDLYMLLGNEAFADASDPTIGFGTQDGQYGYQAASIFCFMNQVPTLLDEEMALLRGRDNTKDPRISQKPFYNRLFWNFTHDLNGGEVAYALNYNIRDASGNADGTINQSDANKLYPQGHGDAWGHYLSAEKRYYQLLKNPRFVWLPRAEGVSSGGTQVTVDYLDERKFAQAAAARAKTGAEIVNLTYRSNYVEDPQGQLQGMRDTALPDWGLIDTVKASLSTSSSTSQPSITLSSVSTDPVKAGITVTATLSKATTNFAIEDLTLTNATASGFSGSGTSYSFTLTPIASGSSFGVVVLRDAFSDATDPDNKNTESNQLTRKYDVDPPAITLSSDPASTVYGGITVTATLTEPTTTFTVADLTLTNASVVGFAGGGQPTSTGWGTTYTFSLNPTAAGAFSVSVGASKFTDAAGNNNTASNVLSRTYDSTQLGIRLTSTAAEPVTSGITVLATLSRASTNFAAGDITTTNASVSGFSGSGTSYSFTLTPTSSGVFSAVVNASTFTDSGAVANKASNILGRTYDNAGPGVSLTSTSPSLVNGAVFVNVALTEASNDFVAGDITPSNATVSGFAGSGTSYSFVLQPTASGDFSASIATSVFTDAAGKQNTGSNAISFQYRPLNWSKWTLTQAESGLSSTDFQRLDRDKTGKIEIADLMPRAWGVSDWASRAGMGAYFDWAVANAMLPAVDPDPTHTGVSKVDRAGNPNIKEISAAFDDVQAQLDQADTGLNPLGLERDVVPFGIAPDAIDKGQTHFEQVYQRAVTAMNNALTVFDHANNSTQLLRRQNDTIAEFQKGVDDQEADFNNRLTEVFGYPYTDDMGGGKTYPEDYNGPDLYHYMIVDRSEITGENPGGVDAVTVEFAEPSVDENGVLSTSPRPVTYYVSTEGYGVVKPPFWVGSRKAPGEIQLAIGDVVAAKGRMTNAVNAYELLVQQLEDQADLFEAQFNLNRNEINILNETLQKNNSLNTLVVVSRGLAFAFRSLGKLFTQATQASAEALPGVNGLANDLTSTGRGAIRYVGATLSNVFDILADAQSVGETVLQNAKEENNAISNIKITAAKDDFAIQQALAQLKQLVRTEINTRLEVLTSYEALKQSLGRYQSAVAKGERLKADRERFRTQTGAKTQDYRYKDMAFRIFRNDALQKYRAQFDLAARYVYMAAKAYDYETALLPGTKNAGLGFLTDIVRARSIGLVQNGQPVTGGSNPTLADVMGRMWFNFDLVLRPQLNFNNPQTETNRFSLRTELLRYQPGSAGDTAWRAALSSAYPVDLSGTPTLQIGNSKVYVGQVANLWDVPQFKRYCIPPSQDTATAEPGFIFRFPTTVEFAKNFFGWPLAGGSASNDINWGGDSAYDSTYFATKIRSVGVWMSNYNNIGNGMSNTPRVYLIPIGTDYMRSPSLSMQSVRYWKVIDQVLPTPFPLTEASIGSSDWTPLFDAQSGPFEQIRRYPTLRAYHDGGTISADQMSYNSRLVGRSVWNSDWMLIIPAGTLHSDRAEGLSRFIGSPTSPGVTDIKLYFQTYAYSGNTAKQAAEEPGKSIAIEGGDGAQEAFKVQ